MLRKNIDFFYCMVSWFYFQLSQLKQHYELTINGVEGKGKGNSIWPVRLFLDQGILTCFLWMLLYSKSGLAVSTRRVDNTRYQRVNLGPGRSYLGIGSLPLNIMLYWVGVNLSFSFYQYLTLLSGGPNLGLVSRANNFHISDG